MASINEQLGNIWDQGRSKPTIMDTATFSKLARKSLTMMPYQRTVMLVMNIYPLDKINPAHPTDDPHAPTEVIIIAIRFIINDLFQPLGGLLCFQDDQSQTIANCIKAYISDIWKLGLYVIGSVSPTYVVFKNIIRWLNPEKDYDKEPGPIVYNVLPFKNIIHIYDVHYLTLKLQLLLRQGDIRFETKHGQQREYLAKWGDLLSVINRDPRFYLKSSNYSNVVEFSNRAHAFTNQLYQMYIDFEDNGFLSEYSAGTRLLLHSMIRILNYYDMEYVHVRKTNFIWDDLIYTLSQMKFEIKNLPFIQNPAIIKKRKKKKTRKIIRSSQVESVTKAGTSKDGKYNVHTLDTKNISIKEKIGIGKIKESLKQTNISLKTIEQKSKQIKNTDVIKENVATISSTSGKQANNENDNSVDSKNVTTCLETKVENLKNINDNSPNTDATKICSKSEVRYKRKISTINLQVKDGRIEHVLRPNDNTINPENQTFVNTSISDNSLIVDKDEIGILSGDPKINVKKLEQEKEELEVVSKSTQTEKGTEVKAKTFEQKLGEQFEQPLKDLRAYTVLDEQMEKEQLENRPTNPGISIQLKEEAGEVQLETSPMFLRPPPGFPIRKTYGQLENQPIDIKTLSECSRYSNKEHTEKFFKGLTTSPKLLEKPFEEKLGNPTKGPKTPPGSPPSSPNSYDLINYVERTKEIILQRIPCLQERVTYTQSMENSAPSTSSQASKPGENITMKKLSEVTITETKNNPEAPDIDFTKTMRIRQLAEKLRKNQVDISKVLGQTEQEFSITSNSTGATYNTFVQHEGSIPEIGFTNDTFTSEMICSMKGIMLLNESATKRQLQSIRSDSSLVEPVDLITFKIQTQLNGIPETYFYGNNYRLFDPDVSVSCLENDKGLYLLKR